MSDTNKTKTGGPKVKPFSVKRTNIIALIFLGLFVLGAVGLFIYPASARIQDLRTRLNRTEAELREKERIADALQELIAKFSQDLKLAESVVFTDRDIATFLDNFSDFASRANMVPVSIRSLRAEPVPSASKSEQVEEKKAEKKKKGSKDKPEYEAPGLLMRPMEIKIKGQYPDLINFLVSLEEYKQLLTINDLSISLAREGYPNLEAKFIIRLYTMETQKAKS